MSGFIQGESRFQATLLPELLDDYVAEENSVRVVDVFVDSLDLKHLGFKTLPALTGRPAYHPSVMLKLYIYGYLNRVQSSRRLEKEANRNVELMWLLGRLAPDFKTIADFRRDNGKAIQGVCREFVLLCRKLNLFTEAFVAIDGSKFRGVNNRDRNFTQGKIKSRLKQIDNSIERYLGQIASADRRDEELGLATRERLEPKLAKLKAEVKELNNMAKTIVTAPGKQVSFTDPDARAISTSARGSGIVGYNVQTAVDIKHHLIVVHEVTNEGHDRAQLANMSLQAKGALQTKALSAVADRGYYSGEEILACEKAGITTYLPKPQTSGNQARGLFGKRDFIYHADTNEYECPAGERLIYRFSRTESDKLMHRYWFSNCGQCAIKDQCTTGVQRRVSRWEHEATLDELEVRMGQKTNAMKLRKSTVEHPFGTIKHWMGATHFQMKTLKHVSTEMSLHVLSYNLKRMLKILGPMQLMAAMA